MSSNGISNLPTKQARQKAKLDLAQAKRQSSGNANRYWNTYDINDLPTKYVGNNPIDNPNIGGLANHRPWKTHI